MNLLLDTHVLLWWLDDSLKFTQKALKAIEDENNRVFVSTASTWEIAIKKSIGKLNAPNNLEKELKKHYFEVLPIALPHTWRTIQLPFHHRDPFDRLLIAQAQVENLTIVTHDSKLQMYEISLIMT